jgi:hypothetical protein
MDKQDEATDFGGGIDANRVNSICASLCVGLFVCPFPVAASLCLLVSGRTAGRQTPQRQKGGRVLQADNGST